MCVCVMEDVCVCVCVMEGVCVCVCVMEGTCMCDGGYMYVCAGDVSMLVK